MNGFDYFKLALSRYSDFSGRSRRSEYWYFKLFQVIFLITFVPFIGIPVLNILFGALFLALSIAGLAVAVRRLHDTGQSGWSLMLGVIPLIGGLILLIWFVTDSQPFENQYGPSPKEFEEELLLEDLALEEEIEMERLRDEDFV